MGVLIETSLNQNEIVAVIRLSADFFKAHMLETGAEGRAKTIDSYAAKNDLNVDEIKHLNAHFNTMADNIKQMPDGEKKKFYRSLEMVFK